MLSEREAELLTRLTAFPGTFSTTDVEQLTEDPLSTLVLGELVDRSLVTRTADRVPPTAGDGASPCR